MKNLWQIIAVVLFIVVFWFTKCSDSSEKTEDVNLQDKTQIENYLQGKWHLAYYPAGGLTIHLRLLIEGNKMKVWSSVNDHNNENDNTWNMSEPPSQVYKFTIGELTAKDTKRYLEWDDYGDLTMQQRAIGDFFVAKSGFHHGASAYVVERGWEE